MADLTPIEEEVGGEAAEMTSVYGLPLCHDYMNSFKITRYIPFCPKYGKKEAGGTKDDADDVTIVYNTNVEENAVEFQKLWCYWNHIKMKWMHSPFLVLITAYYLIVESIT